MCIIYNTYVYTYTRTILLTSVYCACVCACNTYDNIYIYNGSRQTHGSQYIITTIMYNMCVEVISQPSAARARLNLYAYTHAVVNAAAQSSRFLLLTPFCRLRVYILYEP